MESDEMRLRESMGGNDYEATIKIRCGRRSQKWMLMKIMKCE